MKAGWVNKLILSLGIVVLALLLVKMLLIEPKQNLREQPGKVFKNTTQNSKIPNFDAIADIRRKKQAFFDFLRPSIKYQNIMIAKQRAFLLQVQHLLRNDVPLNDAQSFRIAQIANQYQYSMRNLTLTTLSELLMRVDTLPEALVLIQAANETGWGTSRFAKKGFNFFGQWCFKQGCGLVPQSREQGLHHEVAVFNSVDDSVAAYMLNLNSNAAYALLRAIRADLRAKHQSVSARQLVYGLINYSERQEAYVDELLDMLRHNNQFLVEPHEQRPAV